MNEENDIYTAPKSNLQQVEAKPKASKFLIFLSILFVLVNAFFTMALLRYPIDMNSSARMGYMTGSVLSVIILPLLVVLIFQIGKRFRNSRSRVRIFFWMSVLILLSKLSKLAQSLPTH